MVEKINEQVIRVRVRVQAHANIGSSHFVALHKF